MKGDLDRGTDKSNNLGKAWKAPIYQGLFIIHFIIS